VLVTNLDLLICLFVCTCVIGVRLKKLGLNVNCSISKNLPILFHRLSYGGRVGKHVIEIKKAVFVEVSSQDEGVSLSATPGSNSNNNNNNPATSSAIETSDSKEVVEVACGNDSSRQNSTDNDEDYDHSNVSAANPGAINGYG